MKDNIMKNLLAFLPFITFLTILPSEEAQWLGLPKEITRHVVYRLNHTDIPALKQTCHQWNNIFDYDMLHPDTIAAIDEVVCTKMLSCLARAEQEKNFLHFYKNNNTEKRRGALFLFGWEKGCNDTKQLMKIHYKDVHEGASASINDNWCHIFYNEIAKTMLFLSDNLNVKSNCIIGNTLLMWASLIGNKKAVKLSLSHPNIDVNAQNTNTGMTALMLACNGGYTKIVELFLAHPKIDLMVKDCIGRTALSIANSREHEADKNYRKIVALLKAKLIEVGYS